MFEITPDDIARINDEELRTLIARLCEAEVRKSGYSTLHVTWGGNQNAPDGGIDVRVALPLSAVISGYVPRPNSGFQVKAQDMPPAEIYREMRPDGALRQSVRDLAAQKGAYIIASSQGSTADRALTARREEMSRAVADSRADGHLHVDFYDRTRITSWIRSHEGLIPWVRRLAGRPLQGWHSFERWANPVEPTNAEYILDEKVRLRASTAAVSAGAVSVAEGIAQLRAKLREPKTVVRLVGLSGVGKTRLVEALFDERIATNSLDPTFAFYSNFADDPDPAPLKLASELVESRTRAILIIDNCPPELHQRVSEVCRQQQSNLSLITIEYDIREDEPEGTDVFSLEPSSPELIQKLLKQRFPDLSQVNGRTIAEFSGGNARVAISLAITVENRETLMGVNVLNFRPRFGSNQSTACIRPITPALAKSSNVTQGGTRRWKRLAMRFTRSRF